MLNIGIAGHIQITETTTRLVRDALVDHLCRRTMPVHGVSCLAPGADQVFVETLIDLGLTYDVILPARDYRDRTITARDRDRFDRLLAGAEEVIPLAFEHSGPAAYAAANALLVARCRELIAVWDGLADRRPGTTAHAIGLARRSSVPVTRIWPDRARRSPRARPPVGSRTLASSVGNPTL